MHKPLLAAMTALALAPAPAACQQLPPPTVEWTKAESDADFQLYQGNRVVAGGTINGKAVEFLLDTGAGATTIDRGFARSIGIPEGQMVEARGAGGKTTAELVSGVTLTFGGLTLTNVTAVVIDLGPVGKALGRPMQVVLGRELFNHAVVGFDWEQGHLHLTNSQAYHPAATAKLVPLESDGMFNFVPVAVNGLPPVKALLDLGNGSTLVLPQSYWSKHPELAGIRYADSISGGVGGFHSTRAVTLDRIDFGGRQFHAVPAQLDGQTASGAVDEINVGIGMLKPFKVAMDLGHNRLYLEPLAKMPPFNRDRSGIRTQLNEGALVVQHVSPQGPGAKAGIKPGDAIVSIDGVAVGDRFHAGPNANWTRGQAGRKVALALADGRKVDLTLADYY